MNILIKGMEMPKEFDPDVYVELACGIDGKRYARLYNFHQGGLTEWCEAVPVPPHGRLADMNELGKKYDELVRDFCCGNFRSGWDFLCEVREILDNVPTIIPAEEGET